MSREIKFRGWEPLNKSMIYFDGIIPFAIGDRYIEGALSLNNQEKRYLTTMNYDAIEIMQYTGIKDIDGIEVFEGDIVSDSDGNHAPIIWNPSEAQFVVDYPEEMMNIWAECLVVGNIYEGVREEYL